MHTYRVVEVEGDAPFVEIHGEFSADELKNIIAHMEEVHANPTMARSPWPTPPIFFEMED